MIHIGPGAGDPAVAEIAQQPPLGHDRDAAGPAAPLAAAEDQDALAQVADLVGDQLEILPGAVDVGEVGLDAAAALEVLPSTSPAIAGSDW